jgi:SAM-dependent methyltransferase
MKINLTIIQAGADVHAQSFLDPARYLRFHLMRSGHDVKIQKNRLCHDSVNIIFGAHNGFLPELTQEFSIVFVNLEQLGEGGARVSREYIDLLASNPVIDYDLGNVSFYRQRADASTDDVALIEFGHAPYLERPGCRPLEERPIDLLFFGSLNYKRRDLIRNIEKCGVSVHVAQQPLYGPERDHLIQSSKAVLNIPFYDAGIFEQCRAFTALSLGTPVVALQNSAAPERYVNAVSWFSEDTLSGFFNDQFSTLSWFRSARAQLERWQSNSSCDSLLQVESLLTRVADHSANSSMGSVEWMPQAINLGSGKDYRLGWLNIDVESRTLPDIVLDLSKKIEFPVVSRAHDGRNVRIELDSVDVVYADNVLEHVEDLPTLMGSVLRLLRVGGILVAEVPHERSNGAWQDPTHVRAFNEKSWLYYTEWCWYLGWHEWRFDLESTQFLDENKVQCAADRAAFMRVCLVKRALTPHERTRHRAFSPVFIDLPDDVATTRLGRFVG